jgi:hypothetical protein
MTALLHRLGYVYKKPKLVPGKADPAAREAHLADYKKLKEAKGAHDPIDFMDATHPQHNPVLACGWIKRGEDRADPAGFPPGLRPEPQSHRAILEVLQEKDPLQPLFRRLR